MRTPDVPGRSTAHPPCLAGLDALQEVVVLLLLAGLLRPVEEVVLGEDDVAPLEVSGRHVLTCLVLEPQPGDGQTVGQDVVELGVVEHHLQVEARLQVEPELGLPGLKFARVEEGVAQPEVDRGHLAPPQRGVQHGNLQPEISHRVFDGGVEREGFLPYTLRHISTIQRSHLVCGLSRVDLSD